MTAFAAQATFQTPELFNAGQINDRPSARRRIEQAYETALRFRQEQVDNAVAINRFNNPPTPQELDQRRASRMTVRDINNLSEQHVLQGLQPWDASDSRTPIVRLLDLVDLPRNSIANIAFGDPSLAATAGGLAATMGTGAAIGAFGGPKGALVGAGIAAGIYGAGMLFAAAARGFMPESERRNLIAQSRRATLGAPSIFVSDVLERLGMENKIARGVLGFVGDVMMDPLTYLSGGGNVVTRTASTGTRVSLSAPGAKLMDDFAKTVAQSGTIPTTGPLAQLGDLYRNTIKIGDTLHDVGGEANRLPRLREAVEAAVRDGDPAAIRIARNKLVQGTREEILGLAFTSPLESPVQAYRGKLARDFLRRHAAVSSHQFTFPMTGFLANRLRTPLQGRTFDVPMGSFGEPGRLRRYLGQSEGEFVARAANKTDEIVAELQTQRKAIVDGKHLTVLGRSVSEADPIRQRARSIEQVGASLAGDGSSVSRVTEKLEIDLADLSAGEIELLMRRGWMVDDGSTFDIIRLEEIEQNLRRYNGRNRVEQRAALADQHFQDHVNLSILRAKESDAAQRLERGIAMSEDPELERIRREITRAEEQASITGRMFEDVADPALVEFTDSADNMMNSLNAADATTAIGGPFGLIRQFLPRIREFDDVNNRLAMMRREHASAKRLMQTQHDMRFERLSRLNPGDNPYGTTNYLTHKALTINHGEQAAARALGELESAMRAGQTGRRIRLAVEATPERLANLPTKIEHRHRVRSMQEVEGLELRVSHAGEGNRISIEFADELDKIAYEATREVSRDLSAVDRAVSLARRDEAMDYLTRTLGRSRAAIQRLGRQIRQHAESAGGAEVVFEQSTFAKARRELAGAGVPVEFRKGPMFETAEAATEAGRRRLRAIAEHHHRQANRVYDNLNEAKHLEGDAAQLRDGLKAAERAMSESLAEESRRLAQIDESLFYRVFMRAADIRNALRSAARVGTRFARWREPVRRLRIANEHEAPRRKKEFLDNLFTNDIPRLAEQVNGDSKLVHDALVARVVERQVRRGRTGWLPDDPHLHLMNETRATPEGRALLENPTLNRMAQKLDEQFADWFAAEKALGIVPDMDPKWSYFPGSMTQRAQKAASEMMREMREQAANASSGRNMLNQAFTRPRMTNRIVWGKQNERKIKDIARAIEQGVDPSSHVRDLNLDGNWIWSGELVKGSGRIDQFEQWRRDFIRTNPEFKRPGDLWDEGDRIRGVRDGERWMPPEFPSSPMYLNQMKDEFPKFVPMDVTGTDIFETDLATVLSRRFMQHEYAKNTRRFLDEVVPLIKPLSKEQAESLPRGLSPQTRMFEGVAYRPLDNKVIRESELRMPIDDASLRNYWPTAVADEIENYAKQFRDSATIGKNLRELDKLTSLWKTVTLAHPAWWTVNMVGGGINAIVTAGARPSDWVRDWATIQKPMRVFHGLSKGTFSDARILDLGGVQTTEREFFEALASAGVINAGRTQSEVLNLSRVGADAGKSVTDHFKNGGPIGKMVGKWFQFNAVTDDMWRASTVMSRMRQGDDFQTAVQKSIKAHFDYNDLNSWEASVGTRVWPWYRWQRNNVALQVKLLLEKPAWVASFPKLKAAIESQLDWEQRIPDEMRPRWLKDSIGMQLSDRPEAKFLISHNLTPIQEVLELGQAIFGWDGFINTLKYTASSFHPLAKLGMELPSGHEIFTGRQLGSRDEGNLPYSEYFMNQLRPFREYTQVQRLVDNDADPIDFVMRMVLGGRIYRGDEEKFAQSQKYEGMRTARSLRTSIRRAINEEDQDEARRLSNKLVGHWRQLYSLGHTDFVPREMRAVFRRENREQMATQ